jgi:hypothetical protein
VGGGDGRVVSGGKNENQSTHNIQQYATMFQNFVIPYLYEAQHVSGDT